MPKLKINQTRTRSLRTPNANLLIKYEKIALLSAISSQTSIIHELGNDFRASYGTISSALHYFKEKNLIESDHEWTVVLGSEFRFQIRMVNWTNRKTTYDIISPDEFNQYLVNELEKDINTTLEFKIEYMNHQFFDLSILPIDKITTIFHTLIWDSINPLLQSRYKDEITLGVDNRNIILTPKQIIPTEESLDGVDKNGKKIKHKPIGKAKIIATKNALIML